MKAQDLRIGNLVTQIIERSTHNEEQVIKIEWQEIMWISRDRIKYYQPIPLTEEWLLKFGFELINNEFFRSRNSEICLFWTANKNKIIPEYNEKRLITGYDFKHVHQLQNLYFALTGEELTL